MTRTEAIAIITDRLASVDDATLAAAATHIAKDTQPLTAETILEAAPSDSVLPRALTNRELELIAQSKADFQTGRTYSMAEARTAIDAALAQRRRDRSSG